MRLVLAVMRHETNTFSPLETPLTAFGRSRQNNALVSGSEAISRVRDTNNPVAAYIDAAEELGAEIILPVFANANPSGPVSVAAFDAIALANTEAVAGGCDGILLDLHGAMVTETSEDGEGELLRRIRAVNPTVPIAVALDFHTNLSPEMIDLADVVTGYCTYPHVDMYETGKRAAKTLIRVLQGEVRPVISWRNLPMLSHMLKQTPAAQPMKDIMDRAMAAEAAGEALNVSVFGGFPLADIKHVGLSVVVVSDGDAAAGEALVEELCQMAWDRRQEFVYEFEPPEISIAKAKQITDGPVILVDHGDNTGAGGNQDIMEVFEEVLRQELDDVVAGPFWDPAAVAQMVAAGVGASVTLRLGGKTEMPALNRKGRPLEVSGKVKAITDGRYTVTGPMMTGMKMGLGRSAVLDMGRVQVLISERRSEPFDLGIFTHAGIDPATKRYLLIKSRQHFRAGFEPIAKEIILVAGPGVCTSDYDSLPFENLRRPIFPLDPETRYDD